MKAQMNWTDDGGYTFAVKALVPIGKDSFTWMFNQAKPQNFYIHFAEGNPFSSQIKNITNVMVIGKPHLPCQPLSEKDFDALIFIKKTSASQVLAD